MSRRIVRAALTETCNAYAGMPARLEDLAELDGKFEEIRRANVAHHIELMGAAHEQGVQAICFGELFTAPYFALGKDPRWLPMAEDAEHGATTRELQAAAQKFKMVVVAPIFEHDSSSNLRFNTAVVIDEDGRYVGKYRKSHIPYGSNEQGEFAENFYYGRSDAPVQRISANISDDALFPVFEMSFGKLGIAICYDRHFYYVMERLARQGAELIFSPAITFGAKSERMWELEFPTDAARFNVFIGGSNRRGVEPPWTQPYFGKSYFVGPNGRLDNLSDHPNLIVADVDLTTLAEPDPSGWNLPRDSRAQEPVARVRA